MKKFLIIIIFYFNFNFAFSANNLIFFIESAYQKNPKLNAERKNFKATRENINISRSEFLPSVSLSGSVDGSQLTNRTNSAGQSLQDQGTDTETKSISIDQKIFQGFEGYNSLKKSQLEVEKATYQLKNVEQNTIYETADAYFDYIYRSKNKGINFSNVNLFERQVESDSARVQKGEITLTDLAQSESSLAGARANFITAENELLTSKTNFERIVGVKAPEVLDTNLNIKLNLPSSLNEALAISEKNNLKLLSAKIDYEISKKEVSISKAQFSPSASINYSKSESKDFSTTVDKTDKESVKATITWPLIKGGKNYSSIKKSKFKEEQSKLILDNIKNEVRTDTANAWSLYQSTKSVLNSTRAQVEAAEIANEGISLEYDSGNTRTTLDVIQSRSLLLNARIANSKAEKDFIVSKFKLISVLGNLSFVSLKNSVN